VCVCVCVCVCACAGNEWQQAYDFMVGPIGICRQLFHNVVKVRTGGLTS